MYVSIIKVEKAEKYKLLDPMGNQAIIDHCHTELVRLGMIKIKKKLWFQLMM